MNKVCRVFFVFIRRLYSVRFSNGRQRSLLCGCTVIAIYRRGVCPSNCVSDCHTLLHCQNDASYREIFSVSYVCKTLLSESEKLFFRNLNKVTLIVSVKRDERRQNWRFYPISRLTSEKVARKRQA